MIQSFHLPIHLVSEANTREHWACKAKRVKSHRQITYLMLAGLSIRPPCTVTITRIAPRNLDSDNLVSAAKGVRDSVAQRLGIDDASPLVTWRVAQMKGAAKQYSTQIEIESA